MGVPGNANALLLRSAAAAGGYQVSRSLRFNSADSAYLSRTPASAGNRKTWTWSGWVKRSGFSSNRPIFGTDFLGASYCSLYFDYNNTFFFENYLGGFQARFQTTQVFRDPSAWYHIVVAVDTTQATAANRAKIYINGSEVTAFTIATYPSQNTDLLINNNQYHEISTTSSTYAFNGYLAEIHFIDGQALTPSSFAETDATTGQWIPKLYSGSYGTNGFKLNFSDNSNNTASTLGKDTSGNGLNWTPNNFSVTAGAGNDSLVDTPTSYGTDTGAGGEVRGNYATLNPLNKNTNAASPTNGNLDYPYSSGTAAWLSIAATIGVTSGKYYWEITPTAVAGNGVLVGIANQNYNFAVAGSSTVYLGHTSNSWGYYSNDGKVYTNSAGTSYGNTFTANDVIGVALDMDNGKCWFSKNGTWQNSGSPTGGTNAAVTGLTGSTIFPAVSLGDASPNTALTANFGQRSFAYTAPSGFKALVDTNLPSPSVAKPNTVFDVVTYTGNGSARSITLPGGFSPDLIWTKARSAAYFHHLYDIIRGTNSDLCSNSTTNELTGSPYNDGVTAFNSNGYSLGTFNGLNENGTTYVGWAWDAGTTTTTNTAGSIQSSTRVNATAGFSIVTWSYGSSDATVGHGLGVAPGMIIAKGRTSGLYGAGQWIVYHSGMGPNQYIYLSSTNAAGTNIPGVFDGNSSSVFEVNSGLFPSNLDYVAYCFAPVTGYSSFGSYTGNGSSDGPFVFTGFRPRWVMYKCSSSSGNWTIHDTARGTYNIDTKRLYPNLDNAEQSSNDIDILSNGFKLRQSGSDSNASSSTYIYAAFAENPFQYARAR